MVPLYQEICKFVEKDGVRLHMPGHKGKAMPIPELSSVARLDVTELEGTGNLFEGGEPFARAQDLWASHYEMEDCLFLTGGSTMGIQTALALCCKPGETLLVDRSCHRSVYHGMALLDLHPCYLIRPWWEKEGLAGIISPDDVDAVLETHPNIKTVCITSPNYYGLLCDIQGISHIVHRHGGKLIVDGAHGAHLPFLGYHPFRGADVVVTSAHKTLPALGQGALLLTSGIDPGQVREMAAIFGSSSPSYPILISLDGARQWMEGEGMGAYQQVIQWLEQLRQEVPGLRHPSMDPGRLTLFSPDGRQLGRVLKENGIWPELEEMAHVVCIFTGQEEREELEHLRDVLQRARDLLGTPPDLPPPPLPEQVMSLRSAIFGPRRKVTGQDSVGQVAAQSLAPYPPGVPLVVPGERISQKELVYLEKIGYNSSEIQIVGL